MKKHHQTQTSYSIIPSTPQQNNILSDLLSLYNKPETNHFHTKKTQLL